MPLRTQPTLSHSQAAAHVKRIVTTTDKDGKVKEAAVAVRPDEVFDHAEYSDGSLVVVTVDGQKLAGRIPPEAPKK